MVPLVFPRLCVTENTGTYVHKIRYWEVLRTHYRGYNGCFSLFRLINFCFLGCFGYRGDAVNPQLPTATFSKVRVQLLVSASG